MFRRRSYALVLLIVSLSVFLPGCKTLLGDKSGSDGYGGASSRPAPHFKPGFNLFTPQQDIELGRQSAREVAQQVPLLRDEAVVNYVRQLGARLAAKAPSNPATRPMAMSEMPWPRIIRKTSARLAPSAKRIPISRVRCAVLSAITP